MKEYCKESDTGKNEIAYRKYGSRFIQSYNCYEKRWDICMEFSSEEYRDLIVEFMEDKIIPGYRRYENET